MLKLVIFSIVVVFFLTGINFANATEISAKIGTISIWNVIIFEGSDFHRLHNVKITIENEFGYYNYILTKTTDRGALYAPWIIEDLQNGMYYVTASDGKNTAKTSFVI